MSTPQGISALVNALKSIGHRMGLGVRTQPETVPSGAEENHHG